MELEQELRFTSDELLRRLQRLHELEVEKRSLAPGTERFRSIAQDIELLAAAVLAKTVEQDELAERSVELRQEAGVVVAPIEQVIPQREASLILGEWREAERRLAAATPGSAAHDRARDEVERLRDEYRQAYDAAAHEDSGR